MKYLKQIYSYLDSKLDSFADKIYTSKINSKLGIPKDKIKHALVGTAIAAPVMLINPILSALCVVVAGIGKECYDKENGGTVDKNDAVATILPWFPLFTLWLLL